MPAWLAEADHLAVLKLRSRLVSQRGLQQDRYFTSHFFDFDQSSVDFL